MIGAMEGSCTGGPGSRRTSLDMSRGRSFRGSGSAHLLRSVTEPATIVEGQPLLMAQAQPMTPARPAEDASAGMTDTCARLYITSECWPMPQIW